MIAAEMKKIWRSRILWVFLVLLAVLNCANIVHVGRRTKTDPAFDAARARIYAQVRGQWNPETLRFVIDTYRNAADVVASRSYSTEPNQPGTYTGYIFGDYSLFGELYDEMEYMYHYGETMRQTVEKAQENAAFYEEKHNAFAVRESRAILRLYQGRKIDAYYRTDGAYALICYDTSTVLILLLCALCISPVFAREHETQMHSLLKLTKKGGRKLRCAKTAAAMLSACAIALLFYLIDFVCFLCVFRIDCLANPVYSIKAFQNTPFSCSVLCYLLILLLYRLTGIAVLALLNLLCARLFPREIPAFCVSLACTALLILCGGTVNPVTLLTARDLHRSFSVYDICGYPVQKHPVLLAGMLLLAAMTAALIIFMPDSALFRYRRRERVRDDRAV